MHSTVLLYLEYTTVAYKISGEGGLPVDSSEFEPFRAKPAVKYKVQDLYNILTWTEWSWLDDS